MTLSFWISLSVIVGGIILVAMPDSGPPLFSFNESHGPSAIDVFGIGMVVGTWLFMLMKAMVNHRRVLASVGAERIKRLVFIIVLGGAAIYFGLQLRTDLMLWGGVLVSVLAYLVLFVPAFRQDS
jgi:hypothetical protein